MAEQGDVRNSAEDGYAEGGLRPAVRDGDRPQIIQDTVACLCQRQVGLFSY
jgi:hypothetical protein